MQREWEWAVQVIIHVPDVKYREHWDSKQGTFGNLVLADLAGYPAAYYLCFLTVTL